MALTLSVVPEKAIVVRRERTVVAASWFGPFVQRPYIYPLLAPGGLEVTRLGHPLDPVGHSHHRSIWVAHADVEGNDFWSDSPKAGRIVQDDIAETKEAGDSVGALLECSWRTAQGAVLMRERRRLTFHDLRGEELVLDLDVELRPEAETVTLAKSNFGLLGVRVARTLRVHEKLGGTILNSQEAENETGCFGQHATWCDYSGPVPMPESATARADAPGPNLGAAIVGVACFDHPGNPGDGVLWHVRDDGWMGPSLTRAESIAIRRESPLRVRYRLLAHAGRAGDAAIDARYRAWRREAQSGE